MNSNKQRIEFIDLAKGVCIILVIAFHSGVFYTFPGLSNMRMPLYFVLSGLFFKDYGGMFRFFVTKTNKILIPFLFFYVTSYIIYYMSEMIFPGLLSSDVTGICDVFTQRRYFNGPIWFLLCLFWTNIIFCFLTLHVRSEKLRLLLVLLIGLLGALLGKKEFFIPCMFDVAMTSLPFFYLGFLLKKSSILYPNKNDRFNWLFISLFGMISIFIEHFYNYPQIIFLINAINGSLLAAWLLGGCSVLFILFLCKSIGKLPIVSYVGRYSIISLCLHYYMCRLFPIVLRLLGIDFAGSEYVVLFVTLCFCWVCIPFCIKYIPWFVAQKDLLSLPILREKRIKENNNELIK